MPPQKLIEIMQISKFAQVHVAIPTRRKFDKFLVRHGVSPTTQISYTYDYRMRQSKTKLTCASPGGGGRCFSPKRETITAGLVFCLIKNMLDQRVILICTVWCVPFANILLKIHYSFSTKYWLLLCIFLLPFHFSFMIKIGYFHIYSSYLSALMPLPQLL